LIIIKRSQFEFAESINEHLFQNAFEIKCRFTQKLRIIRRRNGF
jgi:hypothetical protein